MADEQTSQTKSFFDILKTDTPPKDFFDLRQSSIPASFDLAKSKIGSNLVRFKSYYFGISLLFMVIFTLLRPSSLVFLGIIGLYYYLHQNKPTIKGHKLDSKILNISTGLCLLVCGIIFSSTLVSILALMSLTSITILSHAVTLDKEEEIKEVGV
nr:unnamed protein product [Papilio xuthus]